MACTRMAIPLAVVLMLARPISMGGSATFSCLPQHCSPIRDSMGGVCSYWGSDWGQRDVGSRSGLLLLRGGAIPEKPQKKKKREIDIDAFVDEMWCQEPEGYRKVRHPLNKGHGKPYYKCKPFTPDPPMQVQRSKTQRIQDNCLYIGNLHQEVTASPGFGLRVPALDFSVPATSSTPRSTARSALTCLSSWRDRHSDARTAVPPGLRCLLHAYGEVLCSYAALTCLAI